MIDNEKLPALWASATDVLERLGQIKQLRERQQALIGSIDGRMQAKRTEMENSLGDLTNAERLSVTTRVLGSFRRELVTGSEASRVEILRSAVRHDEEIALISAHYQSAMQMLMRESLGSQRRSNICTQIEHSGPVELASLASYAIATHDLELGAALCARNSDLKVNQRSFSSSALAAGLLGEDYRRVSSAIAEIEIVAREIINADRAFVTQRTQSTARVGAALERAPAGLR